jgi:hypothetical protein
VSLVEHAWRDFYEKWAGLTLSRIEPDLLELMPPLSMFTPPAAFFDKPGFSAFTAPGLISDSAPERMSVIRLQLVKPALAGIDLSYRIVVAVDAICSASDPCHDAVQRLYGERFSAQVRTIPVAEIRSLWRPAD